MDAKEIQKAISTPEVLEIPSDAFFGELTQTHSHLPMYIKPNGSQDILSRV
jgi:hypothetical protein